MATAAETLTAIDQAIHDLIVGGVSSVTWNGVTYSKLDLEKLQNMRDGLQARADVEAGNNGPCVSRVEFGRPE